MKTPYIMASFVHGSQRQVGWGGEIAATIQMPPLLASPPLSPIVTATEPECFFVWVCVRRRVFCMKVCVSVCLRVRGRAEGTWQTNVLHWGVKVFDFTPFCFFNFWDRVSLFLYNPCKVVEMRRG